MLFADMAVQSGVNFDAFGLQFYFGVPIDGMYVRDASTIHSLDFERGFNEADLNREVRSVAENIAA